MHYSASLSYSKIRGQEKLSQLRLPWYNGERKLTKKDFPGLELGLELTGKGSNGRLQFGYAGLGARTRKAEEITPSLTPYNLCCRGSVTYMDNMGNGYVFHLITVRAVFLEGLIPIS